MVERKGATVDPELREAFATLSGQIKGVGDIARRAEAASTQTAGELARLSAYVYGSKPPPPPDPDAPPPPPPLPLARQVADSINDAEELRSDVDEVRGEVDTFKGQVIRALARIEETARATKDETAKQSTALGMNASSFWKWLRTREGRMFAAATAAMMAAAASWLRPAPAAAPRVEVVRVEVPPVAPALSPPAEVR